jgi:protein TonB
MTPLTDSLSLFLAAQLAGPVDVALLRKPIGVVSSVDVPNGASGGGRTSAGGVLVDSEQPVFDFDTPPRVKKQKRPKYPRKAFDAKIEGTVLVEALLGADGRIKKARVIQSVEGLDEAALEAARKWQFVPALRGGKPVATIIHMPVKFLIY